MKLNPLQLKYCGGALICIGAVMAAISGIAYLQANQTARKSAVDARPSQRSVKDQSPGSGFLVFMFVLGKLAIIGGAVVVRNACEMQPTVETEPAPRQVAVEQEPPSRKSSPQPARRTHWAISTIAVVVGLVFFLVGCLSLPVGIKQYVQAASGEDLNHAVHIIVIFIMAGLTLFGAFLVWFPLRRTKPTISIVPQTSTS